MIIVSLEECASDVRELDHGAYIQLSVVDMIGGCRDAGDVHDADVSCRIHSTDIIIVKVANSMHKTRLSGLSNPRDLGAKDPAR